MQTRSGGEHATRVERSVTSYSETTSVASRTYAGDLGGEVIAPRIVLFMPPINRRGAERDPHENDRTSVDLRPRPQNVIPFTKPRAIAALAAGKRGSVEMSNNADPLAHLRPPIVMQGSATRTAPKPATLASQAKTQVQLTPQMPSHAPPQPAA